MGKNMTRINTIAKACLTLFFCGSPSIEVAHANGLNDVYVCEKSDGENEYRNGGDLSRCRKMGVPKDKKKNENFINVLQFKETSCSDWEKNKNNKVYGEIYYFWFRGFATGYNFSTPSSQITADDFPTRESLILYVDKYCQNNPFSQFTTAAFSLANEITKKKGRK